MAAPSDALLVFVKHAVPGRVKTRLAPLLGPRQAARAYRRLAVRTLDVAERAGPKPISIRVWVDPGERLADVPAWLGPADAFLAQPGGDLGARMAHAFDETFGAGFRRVVIVGTDLPGLAPSDIDDAFGALAAHDAVLGPAADGGYWLLGLRRPAPRLFDGLAWSTPDVLPQTRERLGQLGLSWSELRELADLDRPEDFAALAGAIPAADVDRWQAAHRRRALSKGDDP